MSIDNGSDQPPPQVENDVFSIIAIFILSVICAGLYEWWVRPPSQYPRTFTGIIHDYEIRSAQRVCKSAGSELHFAVPEMTLLGKDGAPGHENSYPCDGRIFVQCQDSSRWVLDSEVKYCFISVGQMEEVRQ